MDLYIILHIWQVLYHIAPQLAYIRLSFIPSGTLIQHPMASRLHPVLFSAFSLITATSICQAPYTLVVNGNMAGCTESTMVVVQTIPGTLPAQSLVVPVDVECNFHAVLGLTTANGGVFAYATCSNGTSTGDSTAYSFSGPASDTAMVSLNMGCGATDACQSCISTAQTGPFTALFSSCSSGGVAPYTCVWLLPDGSVSIGNNTGYTFSQPGIYGVCMQTNDATGSSSVACDTVYVAEDGSINNTAATPDCQAGFWVLQAYTDSAGGGLVSPVPNEVWVVDLSIGSADGSQYAWDFGDGTTSAENYPTHLYNGPGPWQLCLTLANGNCTSSFCDSVSVDEDGYLNGLALDGHGAHLESSPDGRSGGFTLNVVPTLPVGIHESAAFTNLKLWPNPVQDELHISLGSVFAGSTPISVIDLTGRVLTGDTRTLHQGNNTLDLNTSMLAPGLYMVRIGSGAAMGVMRFMKLR